MKGPATLGLFPGVAVSVGDYSTVPAARAYDGLIREAAGRYKLDEDLIRAVIRAESSFDPLQVSPAGAKGLMQIMPILAKELNVRDPFDPRQNIMAGAKYLRRLLDAHSGNVSLALASYNAGPSTVARYKGMPPFRETRNYVKKIKGYLAEAERAETD
jgi:soluble lytic murein transglycosylase-like protein